MTLCDRQSSWPSPCPLGWRKAPSWPSCPCIWVSSDVCRMRRRNTNNSSQVPNLYTSTVVDYNNREPFANLRQSPTRDKCVIIDLVCKNVQRGDPGQYCWLWKGFQLIWAYEGGGGENPKQKAFHSSNLIFTRPILFSLGQSYFHSANLIWGGHDQQPPSDECAIIDLACNNARPGDFCIWFCI